MSSLVRRIQIRKMQKMGFHRGNGGFIYCNEDKVGKHYPSMLVKKDAIEDSEKEQE